MGGQIGKPRGGQLVWVTTEEDLWLGVPLRQTDKLQDQQRCHCLHLLTSSNLWRPRINPRGFLWTSILHLSQGDDLIHFSPESAQ